MRRPCYGALNEQSLRISRYSSSNAFIPSMSAWDIWNSEGYRFVDGDRLKAQVDSGTTNLFRFLQEVSFRYRFAAGESPRAPKELIIQTKRERIFDGYIALSSRPSDLR